MTTPTGQSTSSPSIPALRELAERAVRNHAAYSTGTGPVDMTVDAIEVLALLDVVEAAQAYIAENPDADADLALVNALSHLHGEQG